MTLCIAAECQRENKAAIDRRRKAPSIREFIKIAALENS